MDGCVVARRVIPACPSIHPSHPFFYLKAEAEAERKKRAAILDSEGVRQACSPVWWRGHGPVY